MENDYNINVKLQMFQERGITSSTNSAMSRDQSVRGSERIRNKVKGNQSSKAPSMSDMAGKSAFAKKALSSSLVRGGLAIAIASKAVGIYGKAINLKGRAVGVVENNRYRAQRYSDTAAMMTNPVSALKNYVSGTATAGVRQDRQRTRLEYKRELTGLSLPFRKGESGITF